MKYKITERQERGQGVIEKRRKVIETAKIVATTGKVCTKPSTSRRVQRIVYDFQSVRYAAYLNTFLRGEGEPGKRVIFESKLHLKIW